MFTQCPECATVFEIEIEDLKAADGKVCCGECDRVFNALVSLTDQAPALGPEAAPPESEAGEETVEAHRSGDLFAGENADDPQQELQETEQEPGDETAVAEPAHEAAGREWAPDEEAIVDDEDSQWARKLEELGLGDEETGPQQHPPEQDNQEEEQPPESTALEEGDSEQDEDAAEPGPGDWLGREKAAPRSWPWLVAAAAAGIALIGQSVHYWREDLAAVPALEPFLSQFYESFGNPLPKRWQVSEYVVSKGAVSDHPEVAGTLLVNAVIGNEAPRRQPRPLLKVTLLDRWGEAIGERFFAPAEYLSDEENAVQLMEPGETLLASVLIVDPGQGAVSYGIDACLRNQQNQLQCAHRDDF